MLSSTIRWGVITLLLLNSTAVGLAEEKKWKNETELSYVQTSGNTETATLSFRNLFNYQFNPRLKSAWKIAALYGESDGVRNAENYLTELRADYQLKDKFYVFALAGYARDEFIGIDKRYYGGLGAGYAVLAGPQHSLSAELGLNYSAEDYIDETNNQFIEGRAFVLYEYIVEERTRLSQAVEYLHDFDKNGNYRINSETALKVQINSIFSLKVGYEVHYDNAPTPETLDKTDTRFYTAIITNL